MGLDTRSKPLAYSEADFFQVTISLLEVVLGLLQSVLDLQVNMRPLKMVSNDCPRPKTWVWTPEPSL